MIQLVDTICLLPLVPKGACTHQIASSDIWIHLQYNIWFHWFCSFYLKGRGGFSVVFIHNENLILTSHMGIW